jgi:hypothetical protein
MVDVGLRTQERRSRSALAGCGSRTLQGLEEERRVGSAPVGWHLRARRPAARAEIIEKVLTQELTKELAIRASDGQR